MTKAVQAAIISVIKPICRNIYFNRSPATYPRIRAELKRLKTPPPVLRYMLYLDYSGRLDAADELKDIADAVYKALSGVLVQNNTLIMSIHAEDGEQDELPDTSADVKRISATVPLSVIFKEV